MRELPPFSCTGLKAIINGVPRILSTGREIEIESKPLVAELHTRLEFDRVAVQYGKEPARRIGGQHKAQEFLRNRHVRHKILQDPALILDCLIGKFKLWIFDKFQRRRAWQSGWPARVDSLSSVMLLLT